MIGVYKITNPLGRIYVGSSINIERRFRQYKYLRSGEQRKINNSISKYGYENHVFEVLCQCDEEMLLEKEAYYCLLFDVLHRDNLNLVIPKKGEVFNSMSESVRKKIGDAHRGKKISDEQKEVLRQFLTGRKQAIEHINKRKMFGCRNPMFNMKGEKAPFFGKKHKKETKEYFSKIRKGKHLLGENSNAKKVIDISTQEIYGCAKSVSEKFGINYSTLKSKLNGNLTNDTNFRYYGGNYEKAGKNTE
jgi:group I intron endonuclease